MGDTSDASSGAAQGAQGSDDSSRQGIFGRFFGALTSKNTNGEVVQVPPAPSLPAPGMLNLRRMRVDDVAVPRVEIVSVPDDIKKEDLVQLFRDSGLSRLPVYTGTLDDPVGMIHLKDFALRHGFGGSNGRFSVSKLVRPVLYVPPSMQVGVLLQKMQTERIHMALVIDEYGGVDGLVTIEDLIETVIGEIEDEHDLDEGKYWSLEKPGTYLAESRTPLDEFEAETGVNLTDAVDDEEIDTLGGLVFVLIGRVPARGEMIRHPSGPDFEIVDADPRRIKRIRVHMGDAPHE